LRLMLRLKTRRSTFPFCKKHGKSDADVSASVEYLRQIIEPVEPDVYVAFEGEARQRLSDRDEDD